MSIEFVHLIIKCTITTYDSTIITTVNICLIKGIYVKIDMINENRHVSIWFTRMDKLNTLLKIESISNKENSHIQPRN